MGNYYYLGGGKTGFLRRLSWNKPSPTLVTDPTMPATDLCHPEKNRPLSVEEYKRIQEFPDNWKIFGSIRQQYKQIGNAVPVRATVCDIPALTRITFRVYSSITRSSVVGGRVCNPGPASSQSFSCASSGDISSSESVNDACSLPALRPISDHRDALGPWGTASCQM